MANLTPDTDNAMAYDMVVRECVAMTKLYDEVFKQYEHMPEEAIIPELQYCSARCDTLLYLKGVLEGLNGGGNTGEAQKSVAHGIMRRLMKALQEANGPHSPEDIYNNVALDTILPYLQILGVKFGWPEWPKD